MVRFCLAVPRDERMTIGEERRPKRERNAAKEGTRAKEEEEEEEGAKKSLPAFLLLSCPSPSLPRLLSPFAAAAALLSFLSLQRWKEERPNGFLHLLKLKNIFISLLNEQVDCRRCICFYYI